MSIKNQLFKAANKGLRQIGYELTSYQSGTDKEYQWEFIDYIHAKQVHYSQLYQDLFVLYALKNKSNGFFVEFGATNGITLSNTYLLEKDHGWNGILAEPAKCWHESLSKNRNCSLDFRCVWSKSHEQLQFIEFPELAELSSLRHTGADESNHRKESYLVETVSLNDLLVAHNAPINIDYMSIDTEGSELEILTAFDFDRWNISVITVEHNYSNDRNKIRRLLSANGFTRQCQFMSRWDDWYVKC